MKKTILLVFVLLLACSIVTAKSQGTQASDGESSEIETGNGQGSAQNESQGQGEIVQEQVQENVIVQQQTQQRQQVKAQTKTQLKEMVQQKQQEMNQELVGLGQGQQNVYQNQNKARLAVHTLLSMEGLVGGIGKNVSAIARQCNNSVKATIRAEEQIQSRSRFTRFLAGGDEGSADEMEQEVSQNQLRIQELNQLMSECDCDSEVKAMMQEQIQNMEQEQTRLQEMAQSEKQSKGLFGWLWK